MKAKTKINKTSLTEAEETLKEVYDLLKTDHTWNDQKKKLYKMVKEIMLLKNERSPEDIFDEAVGEMTSAMVKFDFSKKLTLSDNTKNNYEFDYIASCLNKINENFEKTALPISLADALQAAPDNAAWITTDAQGKIRYANKIAVDLIGITLSVLIRKPITNILNNNDDLNKQLKEQGKLRDYSANLLIFNIAKDERHRIPIFLDVTVGTNRLGDVEGVLYVFKNETIESTEFKLKSMAHDLISPSMSIYTIIDLAFEKYEQLGDYIQSIKSCNANMIQKAKTIMRLGKDKNPNVEPIFLADIINKTISQFEFFKGREDVDIAVSVKSIEAFYNNKRFIESIVQNLVINAIKYRKKNGKTSINISVTDKDSGIQLVVQDTGIGMSKEEREKIFTKGYRASLEAEGNGFGLYSVHKYLQVLNGSIQVESRLNIGTIFTVFIPSIDNN